MGSGRHNGNEGIIVEYWQREDDYHTDAVNTRRMGAVKTQTEHLVRRITIYAVGRIPCHDDCLQREESVALHFT